MSDFVSFEVECFYKPYRELDVATIHIDHLDDEVVRLLEKRAASRDHSLESEIRGILEREAQNVEDMETKRKQSRKLVEKFQRETEGRPMGELGWLLVRQDRDEDHGHNW